MKTFAKAPLAMAIAALLAAPYALATDNNTFDTDAKLDVDFEKEITVEIGHEIESDVWVELDMKADVLDPNHFSMATINREQFTDDNTVEDDQTDNTSKVYGSGGGAKGNIGVNVSSGGLNSQGNDAALSKGSTGEMTTETTVTETEYSYYPWGGLKDKEETTTSTSTTDEAMVFAKAATFSIQSSSNNEYDNDATQNSALVEGSFGGAAGNIGVNVASGFGNGQHNAMSLALGQNSSAEATGVSVQTLYGNDLDNDVTCNCTPTSNSNDATLKNSFGGAHGNIGVNIASGNANLQSNTLSIARSK
ncbi:hypothetical protein [Vreelandella arcis]|uniref:Uncharacterized protein n=1 Tax=Vreelandella arcis TaxID=416873 RepID=A0A1G9WVP0_9GAMM|nr:hypothetical protein [Halomonas arcis]SDM88115.1 hypothetical protein SAMN04487951_10112 [Halomonas arcis]